MIGISEKEDEEQTVGARPGRATPITYDSGMEPWKPLDLRGCQLYANVSPSRDHWLNAGSGTSGV